MKKMLFFVLLALSTPVFSDIPPLPTELSKYTLSLSAEISELLLSSVNFQEERNVALNGTQVKERTFKSPQGSIICTESGYRFGRIPAKCNITVTDLKNKNEEWFLKILR